MWRIGSVRSVLTDRYIRCSPLLVAMTKNHDQIALLFTLVANVVNVVGASCKCRDIVREKQATKVAETLNTRELSSRQGLK